MFFYRKPGWAIGLKVMMVFLLIAGGTFLARSAFQAGFMQGADVDGGEITMPFFYPHNKGFVFHPLGGSFFPFLAIFFGGILLIKLISSIVGLVMFKRWKTEAGPDWEDWKAMKYNRYGPQGHHCRSHHPGPWGFYPIEKKPTEGDSSEIKGDEETS